MSSEPDVIIYRYDGSPFGKKLETVLALKGTNHFRVNVARIPPRPELQMLGVDYRRIPVLAIGSDIYCDTSMIANALERRLPSSKGYASIFPPRKDGGVADTGFAKAFAMFYSDNVLFALGQVSVPWKKLPKDLTHDRVSLMAGRTTPADFFDKLEKQQPVTQSTICAHFELLEEQLNDGREWFLDTISPGYVDASTHSVLSWMRLFRSVQPLFDIEAFPKLLSWLERFEQFVKSREMAMQIQTITGEQAAARIISGATEDIDQVVGFNDLEATRLQVKRHQLVQVTPTDTGKIPTLGRLLGLNRREMVIEATAKSGSAVQVHFPRLGFEVVDAQIAAKSKL